jgi:chromosome partitioning protein
MSSGNHAMMLSQDDVMTAGRLILVTKLKGGSGATTTCRELAAAALKDGQKVALIDLDRQGGLSRWWNRRTAPQ